MHASTFLLFLPTCFAINLAPGPSNLLALSNATRCGMRRACAAGLGPLLAFARMIVLKAHGHAHRTFPESRATMRPASILLSLSALVFASAAAQDTDVVAQATTSATAWLALVDAGNYPASWDQAAGLFKAAVSRPSWATAAQAARAPFGAVQSREIKSATFTRTLPGAPDGEYVVIMYASRFQNKANAIEIVTPVREKDGAWRISGYFVK